MIAQARYEYLRLHYIVLLEGEYVAEVDCSGFDDFKALPSAIEYDGKVLGKTGWNSDSNRACYKSGVPLAKGV
jgi:hypothetical protein